jgi:predicted transcriptional regulator of viral defense system
MDLYFELLKHPVFTLRDLEQRYQNKNSAKAAVQRLEKSGRVVRIRRGLYTPVSGETNSPVASRFQIASSLTETSAVSHHSAMEYYGITDQVFYDVYVSSETKFTEFEFGGYTYRCIQTNVSDGIVCPEYSGGIRVTEKERTVIDSIKDIDKIAGSEEVIENIRSVHGLNEEKMLRYLARLDNKFLYQKTGYIFSKLRDTVQCSDKFLQKCMDMSGKSTRYFLSDEKTGKYDAKWRLVVPETIFEMKNGADEDAII